MAPEFVLDVTEEEYEKAGSKFATAGARLSECGMPEWKTPGVSIEFPFTIIEEGPDKGKEGSLFCGVVKKSLWKLREMLTALGVEYTTKDGKVTFDSVQCAGKQFLAVYTKEVDDRPAEEGGTGTHYTKASSALPVGAKVEDLGI